MNKIKIKDLAHSFIQTMAPKHGFAPDQIRMSEIGIRPGEKLHELLMSSEESINMSETKDMIVIRPKFTSPTFTETNEFTDLKEYSSEEGPHLTHPEIVEFLNDSGDIN